MGKTQVKIFTIRYHRLYRRSTQDAKEAEKRGMQPRQRGSQEAFFHFSLIYLSICPLIDPIIIYGTPTKHQALSQKYTKFTGDSDGTESACNEGDLGLIPRLGRSPGEGNGNPLQYSWLENSMDTGAQQATVHGATKSQTRLSNFTFDHCIVVMKKNVPVLRKTPVIYLGIKGYGICNQFLKWF